MQETFVWTVPFEKPTQGALDFRFLIDHAPAGVRGRIRVGSDGHYYAGNTRIRFWGINITAGACFPDTANAVKMADQLARAGFNCVRFHHMDAFWASPSLIRYRAGNSRALDLEALARFDYLFAQLKQRGIYSNINLLVNRRFYATDGLPADIEQMADVKAQHAIGCFYRPLIELQKEYARQLLTHRNPHTGLTYAEDPAVVMIEINNENGLIQGWMSGFFDEMPAVFQRDLQRQWNEWLSHRYASTEALRKAWRLLPEPLGAPMLRNPRFTDGLQGWTLEQHGEARGAVRIEGGAPDGGNAARIEFTRPSPTLWHGQFNQSGLRVEAERWYTLRFYARASQRRILGVNIGQAHAPWEILGFDATFEVDTEWRAYEFRFSLAKGDANARVNFYRLAEQTGVVWIADVQLMPGGEPPFLPAGDVLEQQRVPFVRHRERGSTPPRVLRDWLAFLWDTECAYWRDMSDYLRRELGYRGIILGTIVGCSTPHLMAQLDTVDSHAYWTHPEFPGTAWDANNWYVRNAPMVNAERATVHEIALKRVLGKPFTVTEYDHPAPNAYTAEGRLILAAHAALQDWDGLFLFDYGASSGEGRIGGFFEHRNHPAKWALVRACAALFLRGDLRPAQKLICAPFSHAQELDALQRAWAWGLPDGRYAGLDGRAATIHRLALALDERQMPRNALSPQSVSVPATHLVADTGELLWNRDSAERGFVLIRARRSKAAIGFIGGRVLEWGDGFTVQVLRAPLNGFAVVALTVLQESPHWRALLTALSHAENTNWNPRTLDKDRITLGNQWGDAPTRVSVPTLRLTLPYPAEKIRAWALDAQGNRMRALMLTPQGKSAAQLEFTPALNTIYCELEVAPR